MSIIRILIEVETSLTPGSLAGPISEFTDSMEGVCVRQVAAVPETLSEARSIASMARQTFRGGPRRQPVPTADFAGLTVKEAKAVLLAGNGHTNHAIAVELQATPGTVKELLASSRRKAAAL